MVRHAQRPLLLLAGLALLLVVQAKLEMIDLRGREAGRQLLAVNECAAKGQQGTCNGCVCCCFDGGSGIVSYEPTSTCTCARVVKSSMIWATVVLSVIVVLGGLLVQLYFGGSLPRSPYPTPQQQQQRQQQRAASSRAAVAPSQAQPQPTAPPAVMATT
ncbi:hypothetical protein C2E21_0579 [Chlorella sorokiniana]|uniref:Uncharacterized protein n=1 Tax=Chlorella sorokiniana TaxID=3076 RepID=A0A2P6U439_CHLSO|nr:hypothetical protein C2E21_0579 [Chlorella sorokiniana]|eukprot:PRW61063.1 hypothetical protein C2E21_0579 [Chlorella sorokiniana]